MNLTAEHLYRVWEEYQEIIDQDVLEDRREYDVEMLQNMHNLSKGGATYLHQLIQTHFDPNAETLYRTQWKSEDALKLASNISEALHQDLDGWEDHEKVIITLFLHDLGVAQKITAADEELLYYMGDS